MGKGNINWAEPGRSPHRPREISHIPLTPRTPWRERWHSAETHGCGCSRSVSGTPHNSLQWKQDKEYKINFCKGQILGNIQSWWSNKAVSPHCSTVPNKHAPKNTGVKSITYKQFERLGLIQTEGKLLGAGYLFYLILTQCALSNSFFLLCSQISFPFIHFPVKSLPIHLFVLLGGPGSNGVA